MGQFNNRELAAAFWLLIMAVWLLQKPPIRYSVSGVLRAFWRCKIVVVFCLMFLYVIGMVSLLARIGIWEFSLLKDTIVWFFVGGMAMMMRFVTADDSDNVFRKMVTENVKIVILLEFLVNTYTFPLVVELVLVPLLTCVAMIDVVASMNEEYTIVAKLIKGIQMIAGFVILGIATSRAFADFQNLKSLDTFRSVILAPLLSVLMFPFIYMLLLIFKYELVFVRLNFGREKTPKLKRYARRQIMLHAGLSLRRLQYLLRNHAIDLMHIEKEPDVDSFLKRARRADVQGG